MLATFGLERLESGLNRDALSASDVAKFLEQAQPADVNTLARDGMSRALDGMAQRLQERESMDDKIIVGDPPPGLPTQLYVYHRGNPEFRRTRHANRV